MLAVDLKARPTFAPPPMRRFPLGARDPNSCPWSFPSVPMSSKDHTLKTRNLEPRKREGKFAPLLRRKDDRELRRNTFLSKGKAASEEKRFEARAEQNLRLEWIEEQRQWQAKKEAEDALQIEVNPDLETPDTEFQDPSSDMLVDEGEGMFLSDDEDAFRYYLLSQQQQDQDMNLPDLSQIQPPQTTDRQQIEFWSDDDDFEQALLEAAMQIERGPDLNRRTQSLAEDEEMDVSMG